MRINKLFLVMAGLGLSACSGVLDVPPTSSVSSEAAIADAVGARAALAGAYSGLQQSGLYGHTIVDWTEVLSDNMRHVGTFDNYADADNHLLRSDNFSVASVWNASYNEINRVNEILKQVPALTDLTDAEKNEILGEAYFLRALAFHNVVKLWGETPLRLEPVTSAAQAGEITRSAVPATYTQILADLGQAKQLITAGRSQTRQASLGAVSAIEARVGTAGRFQCGAGRRDDGRAHGIHGRGWVRDRAARSGSPARLAFAD